MGASVQSSFDLFDLDPRPSSSIQLSQLLNSVYPFEDVLFLGNVRTASSSTKVLTDHACQCKSPSTSGTGRSGETVSMPSVIAPSKRETLSFPKSSRYLIPAPQAHQNMSAILIDLFPWAVGLIWAMLKFYGI